MQDPRSVRIAGFATLAVFLAATLVATGCSSGPKQPEPPAKKADTAAKPAAKPADKPAAKAEPAKPAPAPAEAKKPEPAPAPAPVAASDEYPPKPPVNLPEPPRRNEPAEREVAPGAAPVVDQPSAATVREPSPTEPTPTTTAPDGTGAPVYKTPIQAATESDAAMLKALAEEKRIEIEKRKYLAAEYTSKADGCYRAMKYEDAEEWAMKALEQDSSHAPAMDLLIKSQAALGKRTGEVADITREIAEMRRVKADMAKEKARALYEQGRSQMGSGNYAGAATSFDGALTVIQQDPYGITWGDLKANATRGLADARAAVERSAEESRRKAAEEAYRKVKQEELQRQVAEQQKFVSLMNDAYAAYDRDEFAVAEDLATQALDVQPTSSRAMGLKESAARARHGQTAEATRLREKEQFRKMRLEMEEATIPYSRVLTGPSREHWDRITRLRKEIGETAAGAEDTPEAAALKNRLAGEATSFAFDGQTLSEAVGYLSARHGINIVIDEQVKADADAQPLPPFKLSNVPLKDAVELLLSNVAGLTYRVRGNVIFITKPELAREQPTIRIHPVGDLTMKINNFIPPNLVLKPAGAEADENQPLFGKMEEGQPVYGGAEDLIALIKDNVGETPEAWNAEGTSIDAQGDSNILVVAEPALQDGVAKFLNDLRKFSGLVVNIESRFLSVTDNFLRDVGVDIRGLGGNKGANATLDDVTNGLDDAASQGFDNLGVGVPANASGHPSSGAFYNDGADGDYRARTEHIFDGSITSTLSNIGGAVLQWTLIDDTQLALIWRAVEKKQEARVLQSPNLTVYNTQRANITLINQLAFVQDFDVEVAQTAFIADPQISIIQDGLDLDVRPVVSNDRRYVTLQLQPTVATLKRPIQTFTTSLGAFTAPVTLQLPEITIQKAQTTVRVPNGGTLLIGGLKNINMLDFKSETPILSKIPIVSFFFSRRASGQEFSNLLIIIRARITDLGEEELRWGTPTAR